MQHPLQVVRTVARPGHQVVAQQIIEPISVKLAGDDVAEERAIGLAVQKIHDHLRHLRIMLAQHSVDAALFIEDDLPGDLLMMNAAHALKDMTEGPVAKVMKQRGDNTDIAPLLVDLKGSG